ncbi:MAG TPA: hypothetical protein VF240_17735 [Pyrinomonadaceae bacterium]
MNQRLRIAGVLLHVAALIFAVWFGGQVFNALMVVPVWSASLPESAVAYNGALRQFGGGRANFFVLFSPLWVTLLLVAALCLSRRTGPPRRRRWTLAFAACAAVSALVVLGWMAPTVGRGQQAIVEGRFSPEVADALNLWVRANWARLGVELCGALCALRALGAPAVVSRAREENADEAPGAAVAAVAVVS